VSTKAKSKGPRVTLGLRSSMGKTSSKQNNPKRKRQGKPKTRIKSSKKAEDLAKSFDKAFFEYLKILSSDNIITNAVTVEARKKALGLILNGRLDHEVVFDLLSDIWNLSLKTVRKYAVDYYKRYNDGLPFDRIMAARKAIREYNQLINEARSMGDYRSVSKLIESRDKLLGITDNDVWAGTEDNVKIPIVSHINVKPAKVGSLGIGDLEATGITPKSSKAKKNTSS